MIDFFHSRTVSWRQGVVSLKPYTWHSCMQWGWPNLMSDRTGHDNPKGLHLAQWRTYWVFSIKVGTWGWSWQWHPRYRQWPR